MIQKLVDKNCQAIFKHPLLYLFALILLTGFFGYFYVTLPTETSVESLIIEDDPDLLFYESFKEQFGEDEFLVVGFQHENLFSSEILQFIQKKTEELEGIKEVKEIISLTNVENILGTENDFIVRPLVDEIPDTLKKSNSIKYQALNNELIHKNLISAAGNAALFLIRTEAHPGDETYDVRLINQVKQVFNDNPIDLDFHLAGWLVTDVNMSDYMNRDMMFFMPFTYGIIALLLWLFLRNIYAVGISLLTVTISLIWTMALLNIIGGAMSPMTSILPPLIMALIVSDCVHIFSKFLRVTDGEMPSTVGIQETLHHLGLPCFLTSLTTAIGFASLGLSDIPPIRHLGLAAAGGMVIEFVLTVTIIPLAIYGFRKRKDLLAIKTKRSPAKIDSLMHWWAENIGRYSKLILASTLILVFISFHGLFNINVETNLLDYFKQGTQIRTDTTFFDDKLGGATTLELSIQADQLDYFKYPAHLQMIEDIENHVNKIGFVTKETSINSFLKQMNRAFHNNKEEYYKLPDDKNLIAQYLLLYDGNEMSYFIDNDFSWARLSFRINEHSSKVLKKQIDEIQAFISNRYGEENVQFHVTGKTYLVTNLVKSIVNSQLTSLTVAFLIIFICLILVFKSFTIGFLSMLPNLFPILINFGIMGIFNIPLNTATAIISAIAIGIAVDDTVHYLVHYQAQRQKGKTRREAAQAGIAEKGGAILTTSTILTGSFVILCFSSFVPTVQFGLLCSLIMISAVVGDIVILPSLLYLRKSTIQTSAK